MRKIFNVLCMALLAAVTCVGFASCSDDDGGQPQSYDLQINLNLKNDLSLDNISDFAVVLTDDKGQSQTVEFTEGPKATVTVLQGMYTLTASGKVKDEAAATVNGKASVDVFGPATVTLDIEKGIKSPLIFKAIYTTGGKPGYVTDQYFEIVNNSDEVQYLDQLMLTAPTGKQKTENAWQAAGMGHLYESGQGSVLAFPGSGKDFPLEPGQSIVLANDAVNHKELAGDGNNCPDLSKADWEIYLEYAKGEIDYPAPNLDVLFFNNKFMKAWGLGFFGRAYVLARCPEGMTPQDFAANKENIMTTPNTTSKMEFLMMPSKYVLDAVDIWDGTETQHFATFLPKDDAEGVSASDAWKGKCIRRKVVKVEGGRAYYQDTNNSANDFINNQPLTPGVTPTVAD